LFLIYETLWNIEWAQWYIKLNVIVAFHKIQIVTENKWKTAFCTRYRLYEWLITPFDLVNAFSIFQRYINWTLRDFLDKFCFVYMNNILIFIDESLHQHQDYVQKVLLCLREVELQIDIDKCEFEVKSTKYLRFILKVRKNVQMNPQKVKAIVNWQAPQSVKGVQSFIDFTNFYHKFIKNFFSLIMLMVAFVQKNMPFKWSDDADQRFKKLKAMFVATLILVQFNHTHTTVMKMNSSDWCIEDTLLQLMNDVWRSCAYYLKKNTLTECNYKIYNKKMLTIIWCLKK